jgi:hypothetical protein
LTLAKDALALDPEHPPNYAILPQSQGFGLIDVLYSAGNLRQILHKFDCYQARENLAQGEATRMEKAYDRFAMWNRPGQESRQTAASADAYLVDSWATFRRSHLEIPASATNLPLEGWEAVLDFALDVNRTVILEWTKR